MDFADQSLSSLALLNSMLPCGRTLALPQGHNTCPFSLAAYFNPSATNQQSAAPLKNSQLYNSVHLHPVARSIVTRGARGLQHPTTAQTVSAGPGGSIRDAWFPRSTKDPRLRTSEKSPCSLGDEGSFHLGLHLMTRSTSSQIFTYHVHH